MTWARLTDPSLGRVALGCCLLGTLTPTDALAAGRIDREALVRRHNPVVRKVDYSAPLTVGNGGFAFTVDVTGLQTFGADYHQGGIPLETQARWAWVSDPNPNGFTLGDASRDFTEASGRTQSYPTDASTPAGQWLRRNPRQHPVLTLAVEWRKPDGSEFVPADVVAPEQTLDLWTGVITSRYRLGEHPVTVKTACAPDQDTIAVEIDSPLVASGDLTVRLAFPRGHDLAVKNTPALDWSQPEAHVSRQVGDGIVLRSVGGLEYSVLSGSGLRPGEQPHEFHPADHARDGTRFAVVLAVKSGLKEVTHLPTAPEVRRAAAAHWESFWRRAATLDLSGSTDPRATALERRVVLSQYLTAVQSVGEVPPQESGLTCNTWYGKHHTEMIWWHTAHFALWGRHDLLEKNLAWYRERLPEARALAASRGLKGARWPKMVGVDGRESPGGNPLIVWNQPHLIYLCELLHRQNPGSATLERYRELVFETADCLASMVWFDSKQGRYVLGPPLWIAQEIHDPATSQNPGFELAYWRWALGVAQTWRSRLGMHPEPHWQDVIDRISPLPVRDGKYVALESHPDTWDNLASRHDHPQMLMALGFLPENPLVDVQVMERTLDAVLHAWDWETKIWGWDYPMIAMTAVRLGRPAEAIDVLLRDGPNNRYTANGHCPQSSDTTAAGNEGRPAQRAEIAVYLPANGSFLSAVALMVAGWDGNRVEFPGFPKDGTWKVRAEGWHPLP